MISGQSGIHGSNVCQASGKDGGRTVRSTPLPSPVGVLSDLPWELLRWRTPGSLRAAAGNPYDLNACCQMGSQPMLSCFISDWTEWEGSAPSYRWSHRCGSRSHPPSAARDQTSPQQIQDWGKGAVELPCLINDKKRKHPTYSSYRFCSGVWGTLRGWIWPRWIGLVSISNVLGKECSLPSSPTTRKTPTSAPLSSGLTW